MNYVENFDLFGIEAKQIPCDKGSGAPTASTPGAVGCLYMDTDTGDIWKCVGGTPGALVWENTSEDDSESDVVIDTAYVNEKIAQEKTERQQEIAVERARITNLASLEEGSTTGDVELMDIRVGYDGTVYESAGEAVRGQVSVIMDAFEYVIVSNNKFDNIFDVPGRFDDADGTGEIASDNYIRTSKYYPIEPKDGKTVFIAKDGTNVAWVFFYDENKNFVRTQIANSAFTSSNIDVPENTAYFRLYTQVGNTTRYYISNVSPGSAANADYEYKAAISRNSVSYKEQSLTDGQKAQARENIGAASKVDMEISVWEQCEGELQTGLMFASGTIDPSFTGWAVRIAEIKASTSYRITACVSEGVQMVHFRDASGNVIKKILSEKPASGTYQQYTNYEVEVPSGAVSMYVCSCFNTQNSANAIIETYPIIEERTAVRMNDAVEALMKSAESENSYTPLKGKVIVNFGDSIFGIRRPPNDISTKLAKLTGATVHNCGFGGCRMATHDAENYGAFSMYRLADAVASGDWSAQEYAIVNTPEGKEAVPGYFAVGLETLKGLNFSAVDIVTIAFGTNDFAAWVELENAENTKDTDTFAGALRYSIETLLTAYPQLRIFVCSPIYRSWLDANNGYALEEDSDTKEFNGSKLTDFVAKAKEVAQAYHVPFIDNYCELGMNKFNRSAYFDYNDGAHPNDMGNQLIADHIASKLF